ncbi:MAG: hypothetical protein HND47_12305 [Chloroflexi bacterium]|nr:hypothetical protein [Chloroflexota bacterium]
MQNYSAVLYQTTWGIHLNFEGHFTSPPSLPAWLNPFQRQDWQQRGIVVWDADLCIVTHLYAGYTLELLEQMQVNDTWKSSGFVIGSPTYKLSSEIVDGAVILENKIELTSTRATALFDFLSLHKKLLEYTAIHDEEAAEDALKTVFRLIAVYGRKVREGRKESYKVVNPEPNVIPISISSGRYYTVYQAAQICNATSKQVRAWIRKRKLEALDLPGLGIIIEAEKLHQFLHK